jgi:flagellar hook-length control protein FliK
MNTNLLPALGITASDATLVQNDPAALLGITKQISSSAHTKKINLPEDTFSALLAQQIQEAGMPTQNPTPISIAIDTVVTSASDKNTYPNKSEPSSEASIINNSTDTLAAIMLQLQIPQSNAYIKDTLQDNGTVLPSEVVKSTVSSSGYSHKIDKSVLNPKAEGYLKQSVADMHSSSSNPDAALIPSEATDTAPLHQSTLTQQLEAPTISIATDLSAMKSPVYVGEVNQNTKEVKEVRTNKSTVGSTKIDALNNSAATIPVASAKPQSESPLTTFAIEPQHNKEANISSMVQTKDSLNTASINTASLSSVTLQGNATNNLSTSLTPTINSPLGTDQWSNEFSQKIVWTCTQQNQVAELHLNPADLGPLNVTLEISNDQLTAQFTSPHIAVREAIENAMPKLREILADNGIMLNNASVSDQSPRDRGTEGYTNQDPRSTKQPEIPSNTGNAKSFTNNQTPHLPTRRHNGILDTFA